MTYRILSLDGGGIRGLMPAIWLSELEQRLAPRPLHEVFDLIAGTSTGALLGCSVALGIPAWEIVNLYKDYGRRIFPRRWAPHLQQLFHGPKYRGEGLRDTADRVFGEADFAAAKTRTLVTSYDTWTGKPVIFDSAATPTPICSMANVCLASSAAPTYLPGHVMTDAPSGQQIGLVDGGMVSNNPAAIALANAVNFLGNGLGDIVLVSIGTGETKDRIAPDEVASMSGYKWLRRLLPMAFDGSSDAVNYCMRLMLPPERYFRIQCVMEAKYSSMDNASPKNLQALQGLAIEYIEGREGRRQMDELVEKLLEEE